jgi:double-stranded uracil-DNA glycosylase
MGFTINAEVRMKNEECKPWKPTREQLLAANGKTLPDLIAPNLKVLFAGINPGLYTAAVGRHFARPGNRFWPALYRGGFTPREFSPFEEQKLIALGYGIVNVVDRASVAADVLIREEYEQGAKKLEAKVKKFTPRFLAIVGIGAYRMGFNRKDAKLGLQAETIGETKIWVLPNPSGLNAHHTPEKLAKLFRELRDAL